jgi:two-component system response regulator NreC
MIRIVLADDHRLVLDGLRSLIEKVEDFQVVAEATNGKQLVDILKALPADIALVDIDMPIRSGLEAIREINREGMSVKCIALTMHKERGMVQKVMQAGAFGYVLKNIDQEDLIAIIRKVGKGAKVLDEEVETILTGGAHQSKASYQHIEISNELTEREVEILTMIAQGLSNKEIGEALFISHRTVDTHRTNLMKKLDVHNIAGLIRYAIRSGYVE